MISAFSKKQLRVLSWWHPLSPDSHYDAVICDGAVRSGKTFCMSLSFIIWSVYFGCDHADVRRCLRLVHRELHRLIDAPLTSRTLAAAKRQLKGQLGVGADNFENAALGMAKYYLHTGHVISLEQRFAQIDALTPAHLHDIAREVMNPAHLTTLIYTSTP